ncbi:MAG: peptide chain release factor 2 [Oscillospiraceae bacterium]|nr:peptide chain release factor 2 [Oscillospiraceae bacterium]
MILLDDIRNELVNARPEVRELGEVLQIARAKNDLSDLRRQMEYEGFWDDHEKAQKITQRCNTLERKIENFEKLEALLEDTITMIELAQEEGDNSSDDEILADAEKFKEQLAAEKLKTLLTGEYDGSNAILTLHAGAGGTEAQDWTQMLYRMYNKYAEGHGFKVDLLDWLDGDEAGVKSASFMVQGENAYGFLKSEAGVHRLVRVSPFDAQGRRHTSFAAVEVMPELSDDVEVEIRPEDIKMDVFRSSGAGGQHINKTSSAVRLTHLPTGIVVSCQTQRSQFQNKDYCMKMLRAKLVEIKEREHLDKISDIKGDQLKIEWGSQIRSYVFMPYTLVKDVRTGCETGNVQAVMDGDLDAFINAYLKALSHGTLKAGAAAGEDD